MDFIKVYERIRERGMEAEWGTLNNGLRAGFGDYLFRRARSFPRV